MLSASLVRDPAARTRSSRFTGGAGTATSNGKPPTAASTQASALPGAADIARQSLSGSPRQFAKTSLQLGGE